MPRAESRRRLEWLDRSMELAIGFLCLACLIGLITLNFRLIFAPMYAGVVLFVVYRAVTWRWRALVQQIRLNEDDLYRLGKGEQLTKDGIRIVFGDDVLRQLDRGGPRAR